VNGTTELHIDFILFRLDAQNGNLTIKFECGELPQESRSSEPRLRRGQFRAERRVVWLNNSQWLIPLDQEEVRGCCFRNILKQRPTGGPTIQMPKRTRPSPFRRRVPACALPGSNVLTRMIARITADTIMMAISVMGLAVSAWLKPLAVMSHVNSWLRGISVLRCLKLSA
jgi:hypothetical protein